MGDRASLNLEYEGGGMVSFYTHWQGGNLPQILQDALKRGRGRWADDCYLARIIFSQMLMAEDGSSGLTALTGYGISPEPVERRSINVYLHSGQVELCGKTYSFNEYVALSELPLF